MHLEMCSDPPKTGGASCLGSGSRGCSGPLLLCSSCEASRPTRCYWCGSAWGGVLRGHCVQARPNGRYRAGCSGFHGRIRACGTLRTLPLQPLRVGRRPRKHSLTRSGAGVALGRVLLRASARPGAGCSGVRGRLRACGTLRTLPLQPIWLGHCPRPCGLTGSGAGVALGCMLLLASARPGAGCSGVRGRLRACGTLPFFPCSSVYWSDVFGSAVFTMNDGLCVLLAVRLPVCGGHCLVVTSDTLPLMSLSPVLILLRSLSKTTPICSLAFALAFVIC